MNAGYVLYHCSMGVYLGSFMGLGFWSKLDPAGQDCAVVLPSLTQWAEHIEGWSSPVPPGYKFVPVNSTDGYASIADCVAAGLPAWDPNFKQRKPS